MVDDEAAVPAAAGTPAVDVAALVAEIEAEVARRRAAGDYPAELMDQLRSEFRVFPDDEPPEALAVVESSRPLYSDRPGVGVAIVFVKRAMRRLLSWYVSPIAEDQTRFNLSLLRDVRAIERRLARVETPWAGGPASAGPAARVPSSLGDQLVDSETLAAARAAAYGGILAATGEGRTLVLGGGQALVTCLLAVGVHADSGAPTSVGIPFLGFDPLGVLEAAPPASLDSIVIAGLLPRLSAAETLRIIPAASAALRVGGVLVVDCPLPAPAGSRAHPAGVHAAMLRWVPPDTVTLLLESAGLTPLEVSAVGLVDGSEWYAVVSTRPSE